MPGTSRSQQQTLRQLGDARFAARIPLTSCGAWRPLSTTANGQPAVVSHRWNDDAATHLGWSINVLTVRGDRISEITSFLGAEHIARFGLPPSLP
ncbi:MAG: hypothetical protein ACR2P2_13150 [Nakamurella sp.]